MKKENKSNFENEQKDDVEVETLKNKTDKEKEVASQNNIDEKALDLTKVENKKKLDDAKSASNTSESAEEPDEMELKYESKAKVAKGGVLGAFIGLAVIVPGVSGSAVAIIFKMYEKLLYAIGNLFKRFKKCFRFLLPIVLGALVGFVVGFFGVRALLNIMPFIIIALFAGLMFGAYPAVTEQIKGTKPTLKTGSLFVLGLLIPIAISLVSIFGNVAEQELANLQFYHYIIFVIMGFLVAVTQLVPGLSATALLMSFGYFTSLMNSVSLTNFKENPAIFLVYLCLIIGFVIGLFTVSKGLSSLLEKHHVGTFYMISGLSLGSMFTMFFNPEVMEIYASWGTSGTMVRDILVGIVVFAVGILVSYWFVRYERKKTINKI